MDRTKRYMFETLYQPVTVALVVEDYMENQQIYGVYNVFMVQNIVGLSLFSAFFECLFHQSVHCFEP